VAPPCFAIKGSQRAVCECVAEIKNDRVEPDGPSCSNQSGVLSHTREGRCVCALRCRIFDIILFSLVYVLGFAFFVPRSSLSVLLHFPENHRPQLLSYEAVNVDLPFATSIHLWFEC
jgi:hypothetical protein